jgi:iron complex transport system substrate-binding protein
VRKTLCIVALAVVAAACSSTTRTTPQAAPSASFPVSITAKNGSVTIPQRPVRIVSLSASSTEILFAIGAGSQVVAVDDQSNYPANAPKTKLSGFEPNIEAIASYTPDLVIYSTDVKQLGSALTKLKIVTIQHDAANTLDDTYTQIEQLGKVTGHTSEAAALTARMKKDIRDIVAAAPTFSGQLTYYHELDSQYFSTTSQTFIGKIYALLGLRNIADAADKPDNHYPQLSPEAIIQADPDLIFLADTKCCSQSRSTVAKRPGWDKIAAVKNGDVIALDDDIASRWGPRVVDFLRTVADALTVLKKAA